MLSYECECGCEYDYLDVVTVGIFNKPALVDFVNAVLEKDDQRATNDALSRYIA